MKQDSIYKIIISLLIILLISPLCLGVNLSQNGTGQVLIFPHFQTTEFTHTEIQLVNTSKDKKAFRVRAVNPNTGEADKIWNLYLQPNQSWLGRLDLDTEGLRLSSKSKTACLISSKNKSHIQSGWIEVLEMGTFLKDEDIVEKAKNCEEINNLLEKEGTIQTKMLNPPSGKTFGRSRVYGTNKRVFDFDPIILEGWRDSSIHTELLMDKPNLSDVYPKHSYILANGKPLKATWSKGSEISPVLALFMAKKLNLSFQSHPEKNIKTNILVNLIGSKKQFKYEGCSKLEFQFIERPSLGSRTLNHSNGLCNASEVFLVNNETTLGIKQTKNIDGVEFYDGQVNISPESFRLVSDEGLVFTGMPLVAYSVISNDFLTQKMVSVKKATIEHDINF
jgi:hypothetical protein